MTWKPKVNRMLGEFIPPLFTTGTYYYAALHQNNNIIPTTKCP